MLSFVILNVHDSFNIFNNKMQQTQGSQHSQSNSQIIINLAINVFQNVGIKRWIDQIQILKNEQIYFQICKIIFPETIIQLIRINQNLQLSTGQKIQGVINLIAKLIKNDLYHISGQAIAQGVPTHLKNFLELLEALSKPMIRNGYMEVSSAPENDQSINRDDSDSYYTVIGIDKEFKQNMYYSESQEEEEEERPMRVHFDRRQENRPGIQNQEDQQRRQSDSVDEKDFPIPPINYPSQKKIKEKKQQPRVPENIPNKQKKKIEKKTKRTSTTLRKSKKSQIQYPKKQQPDTDIQIENQRWLGLLQRIHETKEALEKKKMNKAKSTYIKQTKKKQEIQKESMKMIEFEAKQRKKLVSSRLKERNQMLQSLEGQNKAFKTIKSLFKQEQRARQKLTLKNQEREDFQIEKIMDFKKFTHLFKQAMRSANPNFTH